MNLWQRSIKGPAVAVDTVVMAIDRGKLKILLIEIGSGPYAGKWALPGGLVGLKESLDEAAVRVLKQKTNVLAGHLEQIYSFGETDRDVRGRVVSVAYMLLIDDPGKCEIKAADYYVDIQWRWVKELPEMAFDHLKIIELAYRRLCEKTNYSNIACFFLPEKFTLTELQTVYEVILDRKIDKRNFRKKILASGLLAATDQIRRAVNRPAKVYRFGDRNIVYY